MVFKATSIVVAALLIRQSIGIALPGEGSQNSLGSYGHPSMNTPHGSNSDSNSTTGPTGPAGTTPVTVPDGTLQSATEKPAPSADNSSSVPQPPDCSLGSNYSVTSLDNQSPDLGLNNSTPPVLSGPIENGTNLSPSSMNATACPSSLAQSNNGTGSPIGQYGAWMSGTMPSGSSPSDQPTTSPGNDQSPPSELTTPPTNSSVTPGDNSSPTELATPPPNSSVTPGDDSSPTELATPPTNSSVTPGDISSPTSQLPPTGEDGHGDGSSGMGQGLGSGDRYSDGGHQPIPTWPNNGGASGPNPNNPISAPNSSVTPGEATSPTSHLPSPWGDDHHAEPSLGGAEPSADPNNPTSAPNSSVTPGEVTSPTSQLPGGDDHHAEHSQGGDEHPFKGHGHGHGHGHGDGDYSSKPDSGY